MKSFREHLANNDSELGHHYLDFLTSHVFSDPAHADLREHAVIPIEKAGHNPLRSVKQAFD